MQDVIIFYDKDFPYDGVRPGDADLERLGRIGRVAAAGELKEALEQGAASLIWLHGPYVPAGAWPAVLEHLREGKGLVAAGGAPFRVPVRSDGPGGWSLGQAQTAYHQQLDIHEALRVEPAGTARLVASEDIHLLAGKEGWFGIEPAYGLILHVSKAADHPGEHGSSGPMDARIHPLLKGVSGDGREVSAPVVLMERVKGAFAGGRWLLVNQRLPEAFWQSGGAEALGEWAGYCARGVTDLWLKPNYASYEPGEKPVLTVQVQHICAAREGASGGLERRTGVGGGSGGCAENDGGKRSSGRREGSGVSWKLDIRVEKDGVLVWEHELALHAGRELDAVRIPAELLVEAGLYRVAAKAVSEHGEVRLYRQGFWGMDRELLRQGERLRAGRDYLTKGGKPFPVVGMTYMTSDVARKFLVLPNADVWDRDMAQMKHAGINLIRTGIWTAWRHHMFEDGHASEELMRSIDAFFLAAKRHGLEVCFTFFAFAPELWEGTNPYLDPRSIEAQKRFIASIVGRHRDTAHVHWDLINEPSLFDPKRVFQGPRRSGDRYEREAYVRWLAERHVTVQKLQAAWGMTPDELPSFEAAGVPEPGEINSSIYDMARGKKGGRWLDYCLFSMDMFNRWAAAMSATIRRFQPDALVVAGQDEAIGRQSPSPFFYAEAVDYTTNHSWWLNDRLVWDGVFAKTPDKPCLIQETGIMYVETPDGRAKRSEEELRNILERKYAYAFAAGGAGAVQWIWNTNYYMDNINESNIGALRADGTEKPEAKVSYDFGRFIGAVSELFEGRRLEDILVVYPYSNDFSNRRLAVEATARCARVLGYGVKASFRAAGEYHLDVLEAAAPRLVLVPSAHSFSDEALEKLYRYAEQGGVVLFTGPLGLDAYWREAAERARPAGLGGRLRNVLREELMELNGTQYPVSFSGDRIAEACKEEAVAAGAARGGAAPVVEVRHGAGRILWCPLPVELNDRDDALEALYRHAMEAAGVTPELLWREGARRGVYGRKLAFAGGALFVFVSEQSGDTAVSVTDPDTGVTYRFTLPEERSVLFACCPDGTLREVCRPGEVRIEAVR